MAGEKQMSKMLTVREVSLLLHVHSNTLRRWSDQGIVRAYRIGPRRDRRFRAEDIDILLQSGKQDYASQPGPRT